MRIDTHGCRCYLAPLRAAGKLIRWNPEIAVDRLAALYAGQPGELEAIGCIAKPVWAVEALREVRQRVDVIDCCDVLAVEARNAIAVFARAEWIDEALVGGRGRQGLRPGVKPPKVSSRLNRRCADT